MIDWVAQQQPYQFLASCFTKMDAATNEEDSTQAIATAADMGKEKKGNKGGKTLGTF